MKKHIPNIITLGNLFCGLMAIQSSFLSNYNLAFYWILGGLFLDFFDGFAARLLKVSGELGKQLDSLADMVTFGVAPSFILFYFLTDLCSFFDNSNNWVAYSAFLIAILSAVRLAKFNISTNQTDEFIGLPTPANALFFSSIPLNFTLLMSCNNWFVYPYIYVVLIVLFSIMLNAPIRLIALKFKSFGWKGNEYRFTLLGCILLTTLGALLINSIFIAIPIIILLYIVISIIKNTLTKK